ncbi:MAG: prepilin-type N-terminal cleavage/methylation domain-containing protein [Candidatus Omnitrophica bacterium]|nr:prepilin-type N-terminal cleavage/methylation domain-containing protein [Candidatus Omnitrophota bacterium]
MKNNQAFTLLELIIVVIVLGALASLALPKYNDVMEISKTQHGINAARLMAAAKQEYATRHNNDYNPTNGWVNYNIDFGISMWGNAPLDYNNLFRFDWDSTSSPCISIRRINSPYQYEFEVDCNTQQMTCNTANYGNAAGQRICDQIKGSLGN